MLLDSGALCDSRTHFRIQVGQRPRALVCLPARSTRHCLLTVPFFVSITSPVQEGS